MQELKFDQGYTLIKCTATYNFLVRNKKNYLARSTIFVAHDATHELQLGSQARNS